MGRLLLKGTEMENDGGLTLLGSRRESFFADAEILINEKLLL